MLRLANYQKAWKTFVDGGQKDGFPLKSPLPQQRPAAYYPDLESRLVHDRERFPWMAPLEAAYPKIRAELEALLEAETGFLRVYQDYTDQGHWAGCYFYIFGKAVEANCQRCPETARALRAIPGVVECGTSLFSALAPGTRVAPHCGNTNAKLRCQFPLVVPENCGLQVADRHIEQKEGQAFVFDDSFVHSAWNLSDRPRFVLLFDIEHPDLVSEERDFLRQTASETHQDGYYWDFIRNGQPANWVFGSPV